MLYCSVSIYRESIDVVVNVDRLAAYLEAFSVEELKQIEIFFEAYSSRCEQQYSRYILNSVGILKNDRLRQIMEHIVRNDGFFPDKYVLEYPIECEG